MQVVPLDVLPEDATSYIDVFVVNHNGRVQYLTAAQAPARIS